MTKKPKKNIYHIILVNHGKQLSDLYFAHSEKLVNTRFKKLLDENKEKVAFPVRFNNFQHKMVESDYELIIIKYKDESDESKTRVRDDYGRFVHYQTSNDDWIVYDRAPYLMEETFWVYGYNPTLQRKDFNWIFYNLFEKDSKNKYSFKSMQVYQNKLLIDTNGHLDMVICKNKQDCIRLYNQIESICKEKKFKYILFGGDLKYSKYKRDWIKRIMELTGWSNRKVRRTSTRD